MRWSIHATVVSCALAVLGAIALTGYVIHRDIERHAANREVAFQVAELNLQIAELKKSQADLTAAVARIQKIESDAALERWINRRN